ncbi:hypothetical protein B5X24_HaOG202672 [Helicoverpa armigera]|uniref:Uncharacterized protein n=1 Tax=Helicoverpa armigera TaxID=29058 RepID=A0A2W1BYU6_HELAM|nr:hypothetical protein B5X24_HaOG202672 [Helicoverpa armigera]
MASSIQSWGCCTSDRLQLEDDKEFINCMKCKRSFHFACLSMPEIPIEEEAYYKWNCSGCTNAISNASKTAKPNRNVSTTRGNKRMALNSPPQTAAITAEDVRTIVQEVVESEFTAMLQKLNSTIISVVIKELAPIKNEIRELTSSLTFHTKEFEELQTGHKLLERTVKDLSEQNSKLNMLVTDLSHRVNYMEQQTRSNNLEIQCLPENKHENLYNVVKQLGAVVGCSLNDSDIHHCTRVAKQQAGNNRPRSIVVQLASPRTRDTLLASVINHNKNKKVNSEKLNTADLGIAGDKTPVFVVEHLSPANKMLHAATRQKAKDKGYKFVWVRNSRIFVRKTTEDEHILIKNLDSLTKLV